jgi:hypothetical protein
MISNLGLLFTNYIDSYYTIATISFVIQWSLVSYCLEDFNLSNIKAVKIIQIFSFICIPLLMLLCFLFVYDSMMLSSIVCSIGDMNNEIGTKVNINGHVHVNSEQAGQSMAVTGAIVGLAGVAGKTIAKSSLPPLQKAGVVMASGAVGVALNAIGNAINTYTSRANSIDGSINQSTIPKGINKFIDLTGDYTPLEILMQSVLLLNSIAIYLIVFICLQLFYRYYVSDKPKLKFLGSIFSISTADKIRLFVYKIIKLNKNMSMS